MQDGFKVLWFLRDNSMQAGTYHIFITNIGVDSVDGLNITKKEKGLRRLIFRLMFTMDQNALSEREHL